MKKILVIDIDDVLVDSYMFIMLNKFLGTNYKEEDFSNYYLEDAIKDPKKLDEYYKFIFTQDMYKDIPVKAGVQEVLPKLNEKYEIEIESVDYSGSESGKNMVIRITDSELLEASGGIVQGMSGSPIIQNGKLIGAVTHVFVADPTRGYGIFAENMAEYLQG